MANKLGQVFQGSCDIPFIQHPTCCMELLYWALCYGWGLERLVCQGVFLEHFLTWWERQTGPHPSRNGKERKLIFLKYLLEAILCAICIRYSPLYNLTISHRENWGPERVSLTPSLKPEHSRIGRASRSVLLESPLFCSFTTFKCNFQKVKMTMSDQCYASSLNKGLWEHKVRVKLWQRGRRSGKASTRMWHLSWAMLNSWSQSCWITNVLIFWLHLLGTYQSHKVKEAIILLRPPKLLKWSHLLFLHPLVSHREFLK